MLRRDRHRPSERELAALADGSLAGRSRARVEALVAGSPKLQAVVREQRDALDAIHRAAIPAPAGLRTRVARGHPVAAARRDRRLVPGLASAGVLAAVVAVVLATIGSSAPTVAQAASLAARPATAAAPSGNRGALLPRVRAAGLPFPYWEDRFGWRASGVRSDSLSSRLTTTVFYRYAGRLIGYTVVSGHALAAPVNAQVTVRDGTRIELFRMGSRTAVTWLRRGHTCVLSGAGVPGTTLVRLAAWRGDGTIPY
jgi:hypothetical protein